jgi:hypothetical protein
VGCSRCAFYRVIARQKSGGQGESGNSDETSMTLVTRDGNGKGEVMGCGHFSR